MNSFKYQNLGYFKPSQGKNIKLYEFDLDRSRPALRDAIKKVRPYCSISGDEWREQIL